MPVLRKRERIREDFQTGGAVRLDSSAVTVPVQTASAMAARRAMTAAKVMAGEAVDEGKALAKAHAFQLTVDGMPVMPESAAARMGKLAQQSYDATMEEKFAHQMTTAMKAQIADAQNANQYDFDAFLADAETRLERMRANVPEEMQGAFQQISTGLMADAGATIGARNASLARDNSRSMLPEMLETGINAVKDLVLQGRPDDARGVMDQEIARILNENPTLMTDGEKQGQIRKLRMAFAVEQMRMDFGIGTGTDEFATAAEIMDLQTRLAAKDEDLRPYFEDEDGNVDFSLMEETQYAFQSFIADANARAKRAEDERLREFRISELRAGVAKDNGPNQDLAREVIGVRSPFDWLNMDQKERTNKLANLKSMGMADSSLIELMANLGNQQDTGTWILAFPLLKEMIEGPNLNNETVNFAKYIPENVLNIYNHANALAGRGTPTELNFADAVRTAQELAKQPWSPDLFRQKLQQTGAKDKFLYGKIKDGEDPYVFVNGILNKEIFEGVVPLPNEREEALLMYETYTRLDMGHDKSLEAVKNAFENRYVDSEYYGEGVRRSAFAPEIHYPEPAAKTISDVLGKARTKGKATLRRYAEFRSFLPRAIADLAGFDLEFGVERLRATTFQKLAHVKIDEMVKNHPELGPVWENAQIGDYFWEVGKDYILKDDPGFGIPPRHSVWIENANGVRIFLGVLDIQEEWAEMMAYKPVIEEIENSETLRMDDFLDKESDGATELWRRVAEKIRNGESPSIHEIHKDLKDEGYF